MKINPPSLHLFYNCVILVKTNFQFQFFLVCESCLLFLGLNIFYWGYFYYQKRKKRINVYGVKRSGAVMQGPNREERSEAQVLEEMDHKKSHRLGNLFLFIY